MSARRGFSGNDARRVGEQLRIDWPSAVELEHGLRDPCSNVSDDDPVAAGKIALAHLTEFPDYYTPLDQMEAAAKPEHEPAG